MAWEPDRMSNSFFSPPAHLCAVTYMTEISLIVTLNNHSLTHSLTHSLNNLKVMFQVESDVPQVPKQAEAKIDGVVNPQNNNFDEVWTYR